MKLIPYENVARLVHYYGKDPETERAIVAVIVKLPIDVIDLVFRKCAFLSVEVVGNGRVADASPNQSRRR